MTTPQSPDRNAAADELAWLRDKYDQHYDDHSRTVAALDLAIRLLRAGGEPVARWQDSAEYLGNDRWLVTIPSPAAAGGEPVAIPAGHLFALLMCSDPWPVENTGYGTGQQEMNDYADALAQRMGFTDWIDAYHSTNQTTMHPSPAAAQPERAGGDARPCTCHPDDNPPRPCPRMFALGECRASALRSSAVDCDAEAWRDVFDIALEMQNREWTEADPHEVHHWAGLLISAIPHHIAIALTEDRPHA